MSRATVWPSRSSWVTRRRVWASVSRRTCQSGSEVVVGLVAFEHPVRGDQDRVRDRDLCPAHPAAFGQPGVLHGEVVLAVHPPDRAGGLDEHVVEPLVAVPGAGRGALAGGLVDRRREPGPRGQVRRGREAGHVPAGLGDEHLRDLNPTPGMVLQQLDLMRPRLRTPARSRRSSSASAASTRSRRCRIERASRAWLVVEVARSAPRSVAGSCRRSLPFASSASTRASRSPSIIAASIARAETVFRLDTTADSLIEASSSISSSRIISRVRSASSWSR